MTVPPLRERGPDLRLLVERFLEDANARHLAPTPAVYRALQGYGWPGNVRELRAVVVRWSVFCERAVDVADLSPEILGARAATPSVERAPAAPATTLAEAVSAAERAAIAEHAGNKSATARALGIDRNTLKRKLARYGLDPGERR